MFRRSTWILFGVVFLAFLLGPHRCYHPGPGEGVPEWFPGRFLPLYVTIYRESRRANPPAGTTWRFLATLVYHVTLTAGFTALIVTGTARRRALPHSDSDSSGDGIR